MAHFYADIRGGNRNSICTKTATKQSGMSAHIRSWKIGVKIAMSNVDGRDIVRVYKTGGSNDASGVLIAEFSE